jgi:hypothetical protein
MSSDCRYTATRSRNPPILHYVSVLTRYLCTPPIHISRVLIARVLNVGRGWKSYVGNKLVFSSIARQTSLSRNLFA